MLRTFCSYINVLYAYSYIHIHVLCYIHVVIYICCIHVAYQYSRWLNLPLDSVFSPWSYCIFFSIYRSALFNNYHQLWNYYSSSMVIKSSRNISSIRTGCHQSTGNLSFTMSYNYVYDVPYWCALPHWNSRTVLCLIAYSLPPDVYCRKRSWNEVECSSYQQVQLNAHSSTERTLNTELTRESRYYSSLSFYSRAARKNIPQFHSSLGFDDKLLYHILIDIEPFVWLIYKMRWLYLCVMLI